MGERTGEDVTMPDHLNEENKSRIEGEGEENCLQDITAADDLALQTNTMQEQMNNGEKISEEQALKTKQQRVQSVFSLVRNQLLPQPALEVRKLGMLQLVHQITKQLENNKLDEQEESGCTEAQLPEVNVTEIRDVTSEESESEKVEVKQDEYMVLLREVLESVEALRKEVSEEMSLLRRESRSHTEEMLQAMEKRLTNTFRTNTDTNVNSFNTIPPLPGVARRRPLRRTMTTVAMKNTAPTEFRPRCLSEPVRSQAADNTVTGNVNGITHALRKGAEAQKRLLLPFITTQRNNKPLHSKTRTAKPAS